MKIVQGTKSLHLMFFLFMLSYLISNCGLIRLSGSENGAELFLRNEIIREARSHLGAKYKSSGKTPGGFDCSGYTRHVFKENGILLNSSSRTQARQGKKIKLNRAKEGDLVFFGNAFKINHVGIITQNKNGKLLVIHSTNSQGIIEHDINQILYWKKRIKFARDVISP